MRRYGLTLLAVILFLLTVVPAWLGLYSGYVQFLLTVIGINIILTVSLNLINGYMGEFSVGHAAFMGVGAYTSGAVALKFGLPFWLSIPLGGVAAAAFGFVFGLSAVRIKGFYLALTTIAAQFLFHFLILNLPGCPGFFSTGFCGWAARFGSFAAIFAYPSSSISSPMLPDVSASSWNVRISSFLRKLKIPRQNRSKARLRPRWFPSLPEIYSFFKSHSS